MGAEPTPPKAPPPTAPPQGDAPDYSSTPDQATLLLRLGLIASLVAIIVWVVCQLQDSPDFDPPPKPESTTGTDSASGGSESDTAHSYDMGAPELPGEPLGTSLVTHSIARFDPTKEVKIDIVALGDLVPPRTVSVVNLWGTYCKPCKREFPGFQDVFARGREDADWGTSVRFVTLMLKDTKPVDEAYGIFGPLLPPQTKFAIELSTDPITEELRNKEFFKDKLPVTFVVDCKRRVRWLHHGALDAPAFAELEGQIEELRAELPTGKCRQRRAPPPETTSDSSSSDSDSDSDSGSSSDTAPPRPKRCKVDNVCDPDRGENISTCPQDCLPKIDD